MVHGTRFGMSFIWSLLQDLHSLTRSLGACIACRISVEALCTLSYTPHKLGGTLRLSIVVSLRILTLFGLVEASLLSCRSIVVATESTVIEYMLRCILNLAKCSYVRRCFVDGHVECPREFGDWEGIIWARCADVAFTSPRQAWVCNYSVPV